MPEQRTDREVRVYDDHRENLTVDVDNVLILERASQLRSEDSHVAMFWNVFRSLEKIDLRVWLGRFLTHAVAGGDPQAPVLASFLEPRHVAAAVFHWWRRFDLPPARHEWLRDAALSADLKLDHYPARYLTEKKTEIKRLLDSGLALEEPVEVPLCIETPGWMLAILGVYKGNLRQNTRYDATRDEVLRVLDAASYAAHAVGKRLLTVVVITDGRTYNTETKRCVDHYRGNTQELAANLPHRLDRDVLADAATFLGTLRWRGIGAMLLDAKDEHRIGLFDVAVLDELVKYLTRKDVGFVSFRRLK